MEGRDVVGSEGFGKFCDEFLVQSGVEGVESIAHSALGKRFVVDLDGGFYLAVLNEGFFPVYFDVFVFDYEESVANGGVLGVVGEVGEVWTF